MRDTKEDKYYIDLILKGERQAFSVLLDRYKDNVFNLAVRISGNREDAEEIAQDSFVKAFRSLAAFRGKSSFATWLYRIAYNTSITYVRKKKSEVLSLDDFPADAVDFISDYSSADEAENEYRRSLLAFAMSKLDHEDRAIISMHYYEDMSHSEICQVTGIKKSSIKVKLFRARRKMHDILEKNYKKEPEYEKVR